MPENKPNRKITAQLTLEFNTTCPKCEHYFDLMDVDYMNDDNFLGGFLKERYYKDKDLWKNIGREFNCPKCEEELIFDELEY